MATIALGFDSGTGSTADGASLRVVVYRDPLNFIVSTTWQLVGFVGYDVSLAFLTIAIVANPSTKVTTRQHAAISSPVLMADDSKWRELGSLANGIWLQPYRIGRDSFAAATPKIIDEDLWHTARDERSHCQ